MVFATLSQQDKEAFFALLDEYFESRPHLFAGLTAAHTSTSTTNHTSHTVSAPFTTNVIRPTPPRPVPIPTVQHSPPASRSSSPPAIATKPKVFPPIPGVPSRKVVAPPPRIVEPPSYTQEEPDNENVDAAPVSVASRIAAAQAALGTTNNVGGRPPIPVNRRVSSASTTSANSNSASSPPPPPPQRSHTNLSTTSSGMKTPPVSTHTTGNSQTNGNGNSPSGLHSSKSIGNGVIDTSSAGAAFSSAFSSKKAKQPATYIAPRSAFGEKPKAIDMYGPPPSRSPNASQTNLSSAPPTPKTQKHTYNNRREVEEEEEEVEVPEVVEEEGEYAKGEWVEALYDFESAEKTDLSFKAGQQIFVTERSSKDWWMAEMNGKEGLVPASYVKVL